MSGDTPFFKHDASPLMERIKNMELFPKHFSYKSYDINSFNFRFISQFYLKTSDTIIPFEIENMRF